MSQSADRLVEAGSLEKTTEPQPSNYILLSPYARRIVTMSCTPFHSRTSQLRPCTPCSPGSAFRRRRSEGRTSRSSCRRETARRLGSLHPMNRRHGVALPANRVSSGGARPASYDKKASPGPDVG